MGADERSLYHPHSYEAFASQEFYRQVDLALICQAPVIHRAVDFATGTGAIIDHLIELGKLKDPFSVIGVDIDRKTLLANAKRFAKYGESIKFLESSVEDLSAIPSESCELVTFCNSIHLVDPQKTLSEAARILIPGGTLMVNTAYEKSKAMPDGTARIWGTFVVTARDFLRTQGYVEFPKPVDLMTYTEEDYQEFARKAGFSEVTTTTHTAKMDRDAVRAICDYEDFARGALPGVDVEHATRALVDSVDPTFDRFHRDYIPRNWMFLIAKKPAV